MDLEVGEQLVGAGEETRNVIDPAARVQLERSGAQPEATLGSPWPNNVMG